MRSVKARISPPREILRSQEKIDTMFRSYCIPHPTILFLIIIFAFQTQWADSILKNGLAFVKL